MRCQPKATLKLNFCVNKADDTTATNVSKR